MSGHELSRADEVEQTSLWAQRWIACLGEPLTSSQWRQTCEDKFIDAAVLTQSWLVHWFAGSCSELLATLPAEDPWRSPWQSWGLWRDATDLIPDSGQDVAADPQLAALVRGISRDAREFYVQASVGQPSAAAYLSRARLTAPSPAEAAAALFAIGDETLRWILHRRRTYLGTDDFFQHSLLDWIRRAGLLSLGSPAAPSMAASMNDGKIPDGTWEAFRIEQA